MRSALCAAVIAVTLGSAIPGWLAAQVVRGVVRDSTSRLAIAGAVISTLDPAGRVGSRALSNERGLFRIDPARPGTRLRVVRLGFRPVEVPVPAGNGDIPLEIAMTRIPYTLQPVRVTGGRKCPRRNDRAAALALLEQARDGLLATVVARSTQPARMKRLMIDRVHEGESERLERHKVTIDTTTRSTASFVAAYSAVDFVNAGFATDSSEEATFYAPDADVLLDDRFANGYCFHVMDRVRTRTNQVGLGFRAADRKAGRIDVDGAIWIDTVARALVDIEFRYVGLPVAVNRLTPGGRVEFRAMPNGVVLIDRWMLRLAGNDADTAASPPVERRQLQMREFRPRAPAPRFVLSESGGELARVEWPDGAAWRGELGRLSLTVLTLDGQPMRATRVRLDDTDYEATTDSVGHLEIEDLAPGPYSGRILDPRAAAIDLTLPMALTFTAARGQTHMQTVRAGTLEDYVGGLCRQNENADVGREPRPGTAWVIGRVTDSAGEPVRDVIASIPTSRENGSQTRGLRATLYEIGTDGIFAFCGLRRNAKVEIAFGRGNRMVGTLSHETRAPLSAVAVELRPDPRRN